MSLADENDPRDPDAPATDLRWPVDRSGAAVRAAWRLLAAAPLVGLLFLLTPDWRLLWVDDRATFLAYAVIWLALAVTSLAACLSTIRWALLACWSGRPGVRLTHGGITMRLGPFGSRHYDWKDIRVQYPDGFDVELADQIPGDIVWPRMRHGPTGTDVAAELMRFVALDADALLHSLRPFISRTIRFNP
jgi:hypothetical protein